MSAENRSTGDEPMAMSSAAFDRALSAMLKAKKQSKTKEHGAGDVTSDLTSVVEMDVDEAGKQQAIMEERAMLARHMNPSPPPEVEDEEMLPVSSDVDPPAPKRIKVVKRIKKPEKKKPEVIIPPAAQLMAMNWNTYDEAFYCEVCKITLNSQQTYQTHMDGKRHFKNIKLLNYKSLTTTEEKTTNTEILRVAGEVLKIDQTPILKRAVIQNEIDRTEVPCIGLGYISEIERLDFKSDPLYKCSLCNITCQIVSIIPHVIGNKHRLAFLQKTDPQSYSIFKNYQARNLTDKLLAHLRRVERNQGRETVVCMREADPEETKLKAEQDFDNRPSTSGAPAAKGEENERPMKMITKQDVSQIDVSHLTESEAIDIIQQIVVSIKDTELSPEDYKEWKKISIDAALENDNYCVNNLSVKEKLDLLAKAFRGDLDPLFQAFNCPNLGNVNSGLKKCFDELIANGEFEIVVDTD